MRVRRYFVNVGKGADPKSVVGTPVFFPETGARAGQIEKYIKRNGYALIRLDDEVFYENLVNSGVPLNHIVFNTLA